MGTTYFGRSHGRQTVVKVVGGTLKIRFTDPVETIRFFDDKTRALQDLREPLSKYGDYIVNEHIPNQFAVQGTPLRWAPLSQKYREWKERHYPGRPLLVLTGRMKAGFRYKVTKQTLRVVNRVTAGQRGNKTPRWFWHQEGIPGRLPKRPMLQTTEKDLGELTEYTFDHLEQAGKL